MHTYGLKNRSPFRTLIFAKKVPYVKKKFQMRESQQIGIVWSCFDIWNFQVGTVWVKVGAEMCFQWVDHVKPSKLCPPDIMRGFLVGSFPFVACVAFSSLMRKLELSIDDINEAIQSFQYGKLTQNNTYSPIISKAHLKKKLQGIKLVYICFRFQILWDL